MRRLLLLLFVLGLLGLMASNEAVAQCAMCKKALTESEEGRRLIRGMNSGILLLLAMPFAVTATIAFLLLKELRCRARQALIGWARRHALPEYLELLKPRIVGMVLLTTALGFYLGTDGPWRVSELLALLGAIGATAGGACVLNHYLERDADAKMERTCRRPLPRGVMPPHHALALGLVLVLGGVGFAAWKVNLLTAFLALLAAFLYVLVYTPLKRVTWLNTSIGAVPGAIPPLCGWGAADGQIEPGAWALFLVLFAWQHPHFYALAWLYRDDYRRAGFRMLPVLDPSGQRTFRQIAFFCVLLLVASLMPAWLGMVGTLYIAGMLVIGGLLIMGAWRLCGSRSVRGASHMLHGSLAYLPLMWLLLWLDRLWS